MAQEYLKSSYKVTLWVFALLNIAIFWSVIAIRDLSDLSTVFQSLSAKDATFALLAPVGLIVLSGLVSSTNKARIVFWRHKFPLPGCFAFTRFLPKEPRADRALLEEKWGQLPSDPTKENRLWYRMYENIESDIRVRETHRDFLFARDLTGYAAVFFVVFGLAAALSTLGWEATRWYAGFLLVQYLLLMIAARTYGERLVCNVLAIESAGPDGVF